MAASYQTAAAWKLWALDNTSYDDNAEGTSLDPVIEECIEAASRDIDGDTGRVFYKVTAGARFMRVDDTRAVKFVDMIAGSTTVVLVDDNGDDTPETTLAASNYILEPLTDDRGLAPARYSKLRSRRGASRVLYPGQMVKITCDWGYVESDGTPPANIIMACNIRAGRLFARREAKLGAISVPNLGTVGMIKGRDQDYLDLIRQYIIGNEEPIYALT